MRADLGPWPGRLALLSAMALLPSASAAAGGSPRILAQRLVDELVRSHPDLVAMEIALETREGCKTVASSAPEDVGEACDEDELGPMRTGKPSVEAPTKEDPVYDVTQALHDASGKLIGALGMDLKPAAGTTRDAVVGEARRILEELEARIAGPAALLEPEPPAR